MAARGAAVAPPPPPHQPRTCLALPGPQHRRLTVRAANLTCAIELRTSRRSRHTPSGTAPPDACAFSSSLLRPPIAHPLARHGPAPRMPIRTAASGSDGTHPPATTHSTESNVSQSQTPRSCAIFSADRWQGEGVWRFSPISTRPHPIRTRLLLVLKFCKQRDQVGRLRNNRARIASNGDLRAWRRRSTALGEEPGADRQPRRQRGWRASAEAGWVADPADAMEPARRPGL